MPCVGLTGGIASGKSLAASYFQACGAIVIDADAVARALVEPGQDALQRIVAAFGTEMLRDDGTLDRARLAALVFADKVRRDVLNSILHQPILASIRRDVAMITSAQPAAIVIVELPLLIECSLQNEFDRIIVVSVSPELQKQRLQKRSGLTDEEAVQRIRAQLDSKAQEIHADYVIYNNGSVESLQQQVEDIYAVLRGELKEGFRRSWP